MRCLLGAVERPCKEAALAEHSKNGRRLQQNSVMGIGGRSVQSATAGGMANRQARLSADDGPGMYRQSLTDGDECLCLRSANRGRERKCLVAEQK